MIENESYVITKTKLHELLNNYKEKIIDIMHEEINVEKINELNNITIDLEKYKKKQRTKNIIQSECRCIAKKAGGDRCSRKRKGDSNYCGTHIKGCPHGEINDTNSKISTTLLTQAQIINGIYYYIDSNNNVYNTQDVYEEKKNPKIIGKLINNSIKFI